MSITNWKFKVFAVLIPRRFLFHIVSSFSGSCSWSICRNWLNIFNWSLMVVLMTSVLTWLVIILLHIVDKMKAKSSSQMVVFYPIFANSVHVTDVRSRFWTWFFSPNCSKFAVECVVRFLKTFQKNGWVFRKKYLNFFKIAKGGIFAVECVSNGIIS